MASAAPAIESDKSGDTTAAPPKKSRFSLRMIIMIALPLALLGTGGGLWFTGILPRMLGMEHAEKEASAKPVPPTYVDMPEIIANLNSNPHRPNYVKLQARIEVAKPEDAERVRAAMPRLQDLFQAYMREMRPEELRGSAGTYRLREELVGRANVAVAPAKVSDVLFVQMLVQ